MPRVLIADDEKNIRATLSRCLRIEGYTTVEAGTGTEALALIEGGDIDLVILDLQMPGLDGFGVLEKMAAPRARKDASAATSRRVPVLVLTAHGSIEKAVRAVRLGALDFIEKPPDAERIRLAAANALRIGELEAENQRLAEEAGLGTELLGASPPMRALIEQIQRVAPTNAGVLVLGENGTGKELVARAIHHAGPRRARPLVTVNCAAIPESLFESELFGHARGAFTGATDPRRGKFQQADGGTIFLDEIGEVPTTLQPKMLRAIESGEVERVGGQSAERVDVRVIAATNRDLAAEVSAGRFRRDLYYRLLVVPISVPPLRERGDDVAVLARHFLDASCRRNRIRPKRLDEGALAALSRHDWPGNVRELRNAMERIAILVADETVGESHVEALHGLSPFPAGRAGGGSMGEGASMLHGGASRGTRAATAGGAEGAAMEGAGAMGRTGATGGGAGGGAAPAPGQPFDLAAELDRHERAIILQALERTHWRMAAAARLLNVERSHLYKKLKALGIERPEIDEP